MNLSNDPKKFIHNEVIENQLKKLEELEENVRSKKIGGTKLTFITKGFFITPLESLRN